MHILFVVITSFLPPSLPPITSFCADLTLKTTTVLVTMMCWRSWKMTMKSQFTPEASILVASNEFNTMSRTKRKNIF